MKNYLNFLFKYFKKKTDYTLDYYTNDYVLVNKNIKPISKFKTYPRFSEVFLPNKELDSYYIQLLKKRRSKRIFSNKKISLIEISSLLKYSFGLSDKNKRYYPSAGALYPLECYLISLNSDLDKGVYHYFPLNHSLEFLWVLDEKKYKKIMFLLKFFNFLKPGVILIITSFFKRSAVKYGDLAAVFSLIESGHVGQNIYLLSEMLNLGCCALGFTNNSIFEEIIDIDNENEVICYGFVLGKLNER